MFFFSCYNKDVLPLKTTTLIFLKIFFTLFQTKCPDLMPITITIQLRVDLLATIMQYITIMEKKRIQGDYNH